MRYMTRTSIREVYKVTHWKSGCVYKTKSLGYIVCNHDYELLDAKAIIGSASTSVMREVMKPNTKF